MRWSSQWTSGCQSSPKWAATALDGTLPVLQTGNRRWHDAPTAATVTAGPAPVMGCFRVPRMWRLPPQVFWGIHGHPFMPCCDTGSAQPQSLNSTHCLTVSLFPFQSRQQSAPNPRISHLLDHTKPDLRRPAFVGHSSPSIRLSRARAAVNLDHKQSVAPSTAQLICSPS